MDHPSAGEHDRTPVTAERRCLGQMPSVALRQPRSLPPLCENRPSVVELASLKIQSMPPYVTTHEVKALVAMPHWVVEKNLTVLHVCVDLYYNKTVCRLQVRSSYTVNPFHSLTFFSNYWFFGDVRGAGNCHFSPLNSQKFCYFLKVLYDYSKANLEHFSTLCPLFSVGAETGKMKFGAYCEVQTLIQ